MHIERIQEAIRREGLDGWLFCNFRHRDPLTDGILGLRADAVSTRGWYCVVPASGAPQKILHPIETRVLDAIPGESAVYCSKNELAALLSRYSGQRLAVFSDPDIRIISTLDASSWNLFQSCGIRLESAAALVQRIRGLLDADGMSSHERAAAVLYRTVRETWEHVRSLIAEGEPAYERDVRDFMSGRITAAGLETDHPPIVAAGPNSGDPHYDIPEGTRGRQFAEGDVIQLDLWAREPGGIYADISWVGYVGAAVPADIVDRFTLLSGARDLVKPMIERDFTAGKPVSGAELDAAVRAVLLAGIPESALRHRTGHGIDTECHGSGVNLDSVEFPDRRLLLEGSCFSVEPGIYFRDYGLRTEIDMYIRDGKPVVSGGEIQSAILTLQDW